MAEPLKAVTIGVANEALGMVESLRHRFTGPVNVRVSPCPDTLLRTDRAQKSHVYELWDVILLDPPGFGPGASRVSVSASFQKGLQSTGFYLRAS